jgi:hypothetical protein
MAQLSLRSLAAGTAAVAAGAAYLDAKFHLRRDVKHLLSERQFKQRMGERIKLLGDQVTMYHIMELADQRASGLWFEGRSWTYTEMKIGKRRMTTQHKFHIHLVVVFANGRLLR